MPHPGRSNSRPSGPSHLVCVGCINNIGTRIWSSACRKEFGLVLSEKKGSADFPTGDTGGTLAGSHVCWLCGANDKSGIRTAHGKIPAFYEGALNLRGTFRSGGLMRYFPKFPTFLVVGCLCLVFITIPAYGYTDPNTIGLISQVLTPLLITAAAGFAFLRKRVSDAVTELSRRLRRRTSE